MKCKRFYSSRFNFGINDLCIYSSTALVIKSLKLLFVLLQMERQWMSSHLRCVGEVSSGGEKTTFSWRLGGVLNRNGSGGSQILTQSNWREPEWGSWRWKHCVTTANSLQNLTPSYCHPTPKKENGNSSSIGALEIWKQEMSERRDDVAKGTPTIRQPHCPNTEGASTGAPHRVRAAKGPGTRWGGKSHGMLASTRNRDKDLGSHGLDTAVPATLSKPQPLFLNFAPEETGNAFFFNKNHLYLFQRSWTICSTAPNIRSLWIFCSY